MPENIEIPNNQSIFLVPKYEKYRIIEKRVLNYRTGENVIAYKCLVNGENVWISSEIIDKMFDIK